MIIRNKQSDKVLNASNYENPEKDFRSGLFTLAPKLS